MKGLTSLTLKENLLSAGLTETEVKEGWDLGEQETSKEALHLLQQEMMVVWPDL